MDNGMVIKIRKSEFKFREKEIKEKNQVSSLI